MKKDKVSLRSVGRTLYYFWKALMQHKVRAILLLILIPINVFISTVVFPWGTSQILAQIGEGDFEIVNYVGILLITIVPTTINNLFLIRALDWLDWTLDAKCGEYLSKLCFDAIINQSMTFHSNHFSGSLTSQANKLPGAFIDFKSHFVWDIYPLVLVVIYTIITAWIVCPEFGVILLIFTVIYATVSVVTYLKTQKVDEELPEAENKQTGQLADAVTNVLSVKSYAREKFERARFTRSTKRTHDATLHVAKISGLRNFSMNVVSTITMIVTLVLIILAHNLFGLSIANTIFLYSIANTLLGRIWTLNSILRMMNRSFGNAKEMVEILDMPYLIDDKADTPLKMEEAKIEFSHIDFCHENKAEDLFHDFSLEIKAGESVGLVGVSGSGKTTLTKLLLRFADVGRGAIFVSGQDIRDVTQNSLREQIAYVPQESSLFHRSVAENIAYGKPEATEKEIKQAAKLANADEFITDLPDGYETLVGERGVKLSGGQRQRIAIARAILKNAPILVLDEATSALDSESEALIQEALNNLMENRTSLVIAHRLSTVANLDRIVVLKDGKIVEQGSHQELLAQHGEYEKLWSRQSGAFFNEKA